MREDHFERLYAEEAARLFAFLAYRTGDRALAEDLLADTFERALRARRRYDPRRGAERTPCATTCAARRPRVARSSG